MCRRLTQAPLELQTSIVVSLRTLLHLIHKRAPYPIVAKRKAIVLHPAYGSVTSVFRGAGQAETHPPPVMAIHSQLMTYRPSGPLDAAERMHARRSALHSPH